MMHRHYTVEENQVFYIDPRSDERHLFLTVHKVPGSSKTLKEQAIILAEICEGLR